MAETPECMIVDEDLSAAESASIKLVVSDEMPNEKPNATTPELKEENVQRTKEEMASYLQLDSIVQMSLTATTKDESVKTALSICDEISPKSAEESSKEGEKSAKPATGLKKEDA